jgi:hypothetical protein
MRATLTFSKTETYFAVIQVHPQNIGLHYGNGLLCGSGGAQYVDMIITQFQQLENHSKQNLLI